MVKSTSATVSSRPERMAASASTPAAGPKMAHATPFTRLVLPTPLSAMTKVSPGPKLRLSFS